MEKDALNMLLHRALVLQTKGNIKGAEALLAKELRKNDQPEIRKNLALLSLTAGNPEGVLELINTLLDGEDVMVGIMAVRAFLELNRITEANEQLDKLVRLVDLELAKEGRILRGAIKEVPPVVLNLAGSLGLHRRVLELFKRWYQCHSDWLARYYVGVGAFNLGRYKQAASHWSAISSYLPITLDMQYVAVLIERGTVPPFMMEYAYPDPEVVNNIVVKLSDKVNQEGLHSGVLRMAFLTMALDELTEEQEAEDALIPLIVGGGAWGANLGVGLLESSIVKKSIKFSVVKILVQAGVFPNYTPIPVHIDGKMVSVDVSFEEED